MDAQAYASISYATPLMNTVTAEVLSNQPEYITISTDTYRSRELAISENILDLLQPETWSDPLGKVDISQNKLNWRISALHTLRVCGPRLLPPPSIIPSTEYITPNNCPTNIREMDTWWSVSMSPGWSLSKIIAQTIILRIIEVADYLDWEELSVVQCRALTLSNMDEDYAWTQRWVQEDPLLFGYRRLMNPEWDIDECGFRRPSYGAQAIEWLDYYYVWASRPDAKSIKTLDPGLVFHGSHYLCKELVWGLRLAYAIAPNHGCNDDRFLCLLALSFFNLHYYYQVIDASNMQLDSSSELITFIAYSSESWDLQRDTVIDVIKFCAEVVNLKNGPAYCVYLWANEFISCYDGPEKEMLYVGKQWIEEEDSNGVQSNLIAPYVIKDTELLWYPKPIHISVRPYLLPLSDFLLVNVPT